MLTRLDNLTIDFMLAVIITDCLVGFFVWYEVLYNVGDSWLATTIGVGAGTAIALSVTIVTFAHWEMIRMISERYKRLRYEEGRKRGREEGREEARKEQMKRVEEFFQRSGLELTPEDREKLFGELETTDG